MFGGVGGRSISIVILLLCLMVSASGLSAQSPGRDNNGSRWLTQGFRSSLNVPDKESIKGKRSGLLDIELDPVDARVAFDIVSDLMAIEDADARPVYMWGEDSGLFDGFFKQGHALALEPEGKSYYWELYFLNDIDSLIYFHLVVGTNIIDSEITHIRDFPPYELPPIPLSDIKTIPDNFISSQDALQAARSYGLDSLLAMTDFHGYYELEYSLGGFFFEYPDLLDENSPAFWDILYDSYTWNPDLETDEWIETNFLINAVTGALLGKLIRTYGDIEAVDFLDVYPSVAEYVEEELESSMFFQVFGSETAWLPELPAGKSQDWMLVWIDPETEVIDMLFTRGHDISGHETFHLSSIPEDQRPPIDQFRPIEDLQVGSGGALQIAMGNGLSAELNDAPDGASARIQYNLYRIPFIFPDLLDENANAFWHLNVTIEVYNEQWELTFMRQSSHFVDATNGDYLGSFSDVSSGDQEQLPSVIVLHQNYPNPFNPATTIRWEMDAGQHVVISVFDLLGRKVATLADQFYPAGIHAVPIDASTLASGVYLYRLEAGGVVLNKKLTVLK